MSIEIKDKIQRALSSFSKGNLFDNSINLFNSLGYITERQSPLDKTTFKEFKEYYINGKKFDEAKAKSTEWRYVNLLFQLSKEEVLKQTSLFDTKRVDSTIIETYLFFVIELNKEQYSRTELSLISREVNRLFPMPVMILFRYGNNITLSVINRRLHKRDESKDVLEKITLIKDINISEPHRAHIEILFDLTFDELKLRHQFTNFVELHSAWQTTLDTKELNKRFFNELANWYFWASTKVVFPDDEIKEKETRNATGVIRLITRLMFVWFLKEKNLVPADLFDHKKLRQLLNYGDQNKSTYYKAVLQNLFFATLNTEMGKRKFRSAGDKAQSSHYFIHNLFRYEKEFVNPKETLEKYFAPIPFLNGGLFECLDKQVEVNGKLKAIRIDGFSDRDDNMLKVPDELFFSEKERTIDLSEVYGTPKKSKEKVRGLIDILNSYKFTIAENTPIEEEVALDPELLGKVFENLLANYNPETQTTARKQTGSFYTPREIVNYMVDESLVAYFKKQGTDEQTELKLRELLSYSESPNPFGKKQTENLIEAIDNIKIIDPACGSGAFPMGILHKLVHVLHKLDPRNELWKQRQIEKASAIDDALSREAAIDTIEEAFENNELDYGRKLYLIENCIYGVDIQPIAVQIAKLRFFISLIVEQKSHPKKENLGVRPLPNLETKFVAANTLKELEKEHANLFTNPEIERKKEQLKKVRHDYFEARTPKRKESCRNKDKQIRDELTQLLIDNHDLQPETAKKIVAWNPYDQNTFASFYDTEWMFGLKDGFDVVVGNPPYGVTFSKDEKANLRVLFPESQFKIDSYSLFVLKSISLLNSGGYCTFIITNTLLDNYFEEKVREKLLKNTSVKEINDLDDKVFETAVVHTMIFSFSNEKPTKNSLVKSNHSNSLISGHKFIPQEYFIKQDKFTFAIREYENKGLISTLRDNTIPLNQVLDLRQAIKTGDDEIYILSKATRKNHKPILRGKDVFSWKINPPSLYVDYGDYLACPRDHKIFEQPKILIREAGSMITASYDDNNFYIMSSLYNGILINDNYSLLYLLCLINSKIFQFLMNKQTFEKTKGAFTKAKIYHYDRLPVKVADPYLQATLSNLASYVLLLKRNDKDSAFWERLIDAIVYELYIPKELKRNNCEVIRYLPKLPVLREGDDNKKLKEILRIYTELSAPNHQISVAMFKMDSITEIRTIENKN